MFCWPAGWHRLRLRRELWVAFLVLSVAAFFVILIIGRYPQAIFAFNVGVLRWSWRVGYYSYSALGTDQYPPFSMADDPNYPARLSLEYPQSLSHRLILVKWWLLVLPHYLIIGVFTGAAFVWTWAAANFLPQQRPASNSDRSRCPQPDPVPNFLPGMTPHWPIHL